MTVLNCAPKGELPAKPGEGGQTPSPQPPPGSHSRVTGVTGVTVTLYETPVLCD